MKKLLLGTVALAALGASANAADMRARPRVAAVVPYTTWTGCHVGGAVGTEWGRDPGYSSTSQSGVTFLPGVAVFPGQQIANGFDMNGFNGGFYAGCDYQSGAWVFGFEGDWLTVNKDGQAVSNPFNTNAGPLAFAVPVAYSAKERWFGTARGRLGYAVDKWLFFVSGGAAWAKIDSDAFATITPFGAPVPYFPERYPHRLDAWERGRNTRSPTAGRSEANISISGYRTTRPLLLARSATREVHFPPS